MYEPIGPKIRNKLSLLATNASSAEVRSWIKPGNVHRTNDFPDTTYKDFLSAVYESKKSWEDLYTRLYEDYMDPKRNLGRYYVDFLNNAVSRMNTAQTGGNVLLGHYMLMGPLYITSAFAYHQHVNSNKEFWDFNERILSQSTFEDTIELYKAINSANPGGLGKIGEYDLTSENFESELAEDNINLLKIFEISAERDTISAELSSNYQFIRTTALPKLVKLTDEYGDGIARFTSIFSRKLINRDIIQVSPKFNELVMRLFLFILGSKPDTLIIRKTDLATATEISRKSMRLFDDFYTLDSGIWFGQVDKFDQDLQTNSGLTNPGTTADLLATSIFLYFVKQDLDRSK